MIICACSHSGSCEWLKGYSLRHLLNTEAWGQHELLASQGRKTAQRPGTAGHSRAEVQREAGNEAEQGGLWTSTASSHLQGC